MSLLREEFFRLLPRAVAAFEVDGDAVLWSEGGRPATIRLSRLPDLRLGSVTITRHGVEVDLGECTEAEGDAFMGRFQRAFLRGGG